MKQLRRFFSVVFAGVLIATGAFARTPQAADTTTVVTFRFLSGNDMFLLKGNEAELKRLCLLIDEYSGEITAGRMPVYVDGYCASLPTRRENLRTAFIRANRVKSELIMRKGLTEDHFITANYASAYGNRRDVVLVTFRIPAKEEPERTAPEREEAPAEVIPEPQPTVEKEPEPVADEPAQAPEAAPAPAVPARPYCLAVRTNLLYDAFLLPTLGVEWRISRDFGIRLDGSLSRWDGSGGKVQKIWALNPEARWYLLENKRFYVGVSGSYGEYNLYKYMLGGLFKDDTGYQGKLWSAGLSVGYQLYLSRNFSVDFNFGLGYIRSEYDSFRIAEGTRVYERRGGSKNFWGPAQAGISLVWTIGRNNEK